MSTIIGWILLLFGTDIHCVQGTTPDYFGYSLELSGEVSLRLLDGLKSLYKDIHGSQMMNSNNFGDPLTFHLAQSSQLFNLYNTWFIYLTIQSHKTTGGPAVFLLSVLPVQTTFLSPVRGNFGHLWLSREVHVLFFVFSWTHCWWTLAIRTSSFFQHWQGLMPLRVMKMSRIIAEMYSSLSFGFAIGSLLADILQRVK